MAIEKVKANVSGGAGGSRWARRAIVKDAARKVRRKDDVRAIAEEIIDRRANLLRRLADR